MDKAEAVDDSTVRITTKTVSASFLARLGALGNFVYPQHGLQQLLDNKPIGGGPFRFVSYERDVRLLVERNPSYFKKDAQGRALPYLDRMEIFIIIDPPSRLAAFRTGRLDIMDNVTQVKESDFKNIKGSLPDLTGVALRTGWIYWLFRNKPPWSDVRVRKAFHLVMDRQEWNLINNEGQGDPYVLYTNTGGQWVVPPDEVATLPGYRQPKDADIAEAKRLLQEAGYDLKRVVPITIGTTYPNQAATGSGILRRSLGIDSTLIVREGVAFTQDQRAGNFEILYDSNSASVDDPSLTLPPWYRSNGNNNWTGFGDPELDKQLDALETTLDFKARLKIAQDVQRRITNELFWTAVHGGLARKYIWRGFIQGWVPHQGTQDGPPYRHETTWVEKS